MSGTLLPVSQQYFDNNGNPLAGGKIYTYRAGTTTLQLSYSDPDLTTPNTNPVILDSAGRGNIWLLPDTYYKIVVKTSADVTISTTDDVTGSGSTASGSIGAIGINIKDYGATGDGITDDTASIEAAMAAASAAQTFIYVPSGTFKITSTLSNALYPYLMGVVGESSQYSIISGESLTGHGLIFNNCPPGARFENFRIVGPGRTSGLTSSGILLPVDGLGPITISYKVTMRNVTVIEFPMYGFYWQVPIVSTYENLVAENIGMIGFFVDKFTNPYVGGTSTKWIGCYANRCDQKGYYLRAHVYASFDSCAADYCPISYHLSECSSITMNGCGLESADDNSLTDGIGLYIQDCVAGISVTSLWAYNFKRIGSVGIKIENSSNVGINNCEFLKELTETTNDIWITNASNNNTFNNNVNLNRADGRAKFLDDTSGNGRNLFYYGSQFGVVNFDQPDTFENSFYTVGNISVEGATSTGSINLYNNGGATGFPATTVNSTPAIAFGSGAADVDVIIGRAGAGLLSLTGSVQDNLDVSGASNPQFSITNTGITQNWVIAADNGGGLAIYDATSDTTLANFGNGVSGRTTLYNGIDLSGGKLVASGICGIAIFSGGTSVGVTNSNVTASSVIIVSINTLFSGAASALYIVSQGAGTFTIGSAAALDASVNYFIVEQ